MNICNDCLDKSYHNKPHNDSVGKCDKCNEHKLTSYFGVSSLRMKCDDNIPTKESTDKNK